MKLESLKAEKVRRWDVEKLTNLFEPSRLPSSLP